MAGRVTALAEGETALRVGLEGQVAEATIHVEGFQENSHPTFSRDVIGVLTARGCNGSNCHGGVKGRGGFKLSLYGAYPREDYRWITEGGAY